MKKENQPDKLTRTEGATRLKYAVAKRLRWSEMDFAQYQYEQGIAYLRAYLTTSPPNPLSGREGEEWSISLIERSRIFWSWWKNHWTNRDQAFIDFTNNTAYNIDTLREIYYEMHDANVLAKCIYPNGVILSESYAEMVTELVATETARV